MKLSDIVRLKHLPLIFGSAAALTSSASENLIINGDFETGITGGGYGSYRSEAVLFATDTLSSPIINRSNWLITKTYQASEFKDLYPPSPSSEGWALRMGRYTDSYVTNTRSMRLEGSEYYFSARHWGERPDSVGSEFTAALVGVGNTRGVNQIIGSFVDSTRGEAQISSTEFTLQVPGDYQIQLSGSGNLDQTSRAWLDDLTLVDIPEPSSIATLLSLASFCLAFSCRRKRPVG